MQTETQNRENPDQQFKPFTSRELAEAIDRLIVTRIAQVQAENLGWRDVFKANEVEAELNLRQIADAFKRLDQNPGVAVFTKPE